jgi:hypothetical protein
MKNKFLFLPLVGFLIFFSCQNQNKENEDSEVIPKVWTVEQTKLWEQEHGWLRGANFNPSTAINQLEMWQEETFDPETIDRELGWAADIGMNCMRVYLHHVAWDVDKDEFKNRMQEYLDIAESHGIKTIFVFFDDCWNATYQAGKQPEPKPGVHNSGWIQDPGILIFEDSTLTDKLEIYVKDVLQHFSNHQGIVLWDLYNEPGNSAYEGKSMNLLKKVFEWAWEVRPSQPLTAGIWNPGLVEFNQFQLQVSDIVSYHSYVGPANHKNTIDTLKKYDRPLVCTEYMARTRNSTFENTMPLLKHENVGAINWGLVAGKTNTIYAWDEPIPEGSEPKLWFHDIFRSDGTPYKQEEVDLIKSLTLGN